MVDPSLFELIPLEDRDITGNFEVTILKNSERQLIYSKKPCGSAQAESMADRQEILERIQEALDDDDDDDDDEM
jgi:hypothetical protein